MKIPPNSEPQEPITGLSQKEVATRRAQGLGNEKDNSNIKSYGQIVRGNVFTFFNFLNLTLFALVLLVGSLRNGLFIFNVIINTAIGIIQECRAKRIIEKLSILTQEKAIVLREGRYETVPTQELVLGDVIELRNGNQVPADTKILSGSCEVNESLLTGESDNLPKSVGDGLYSGSFITSGLVLCEITQVGNQSYAGRITQEAKVYKRHSSELRGALDAILKIVSVIIVPLGILLFYKAYILGGEGLRRSVISTVAGVQGMIPEGLYLLTSVALTVGSIVLAQRQTLVQELYCIETLARVDTLCLDKTGTITTGEMALHSIVPYEGSYQTPILLSKTGEASKEEILSSLYNYTLLDETYTPFETRPAILEAIAQQSYEDGKDAQYAQVLANMLSALKDNNPTIKALRNAIEPREDLIPTYVIPFSSDRKYSGVSFQGVGTYLMGAAAFLFPDGYLDIQEVTRSFAGEGLRVMVLAHSPHLVTDNSLPDQLRPLALILLTDIIRPEAPQTISYFYDQDVDVRVISGDDPLTVSAIAAKAGVKGAEHFVDASTLKSEEDLRKAVHTCTVFGRVTPQQKKAMVSILQDGGHTVAMTGDGVNDVLAMKEADCSIAMNQGSDAAKSVSSIVLLNNDFSSLPAAVNQGRRVINNIQSAASMFLIKTSFSLMLCLITIFWMDSYPFQPIQMTLIGACAVGIPTFLLSQEPNYNKITRGFLRLVFQRALPWALAITGCVVTIMISCEFFYHSNEMLGTACFLVTGWNYMAALQTVYEPLNVYRTIIIYGMQVIFFGAAVLFRNLLSLQSLEFGMIILVFVLMTFSPLLTRIITHSLQRLYLRRQEEGAVSGKKGFFRRWIYKNVNKKDS